MESSIPLTRSLDQPDDDSYTGLVDKAAQTDRQKKSDALEILIENRRKRIMIAFSSGFGLAAFILTYFVLIANLIKTDTETSSTTVPYSQYNCFDQGWIGYRDNCYNVSTALLTWNEAAEFCSDIGSHLAIVYTSEDIKFLQTLSAANFRYGTKGTAIWLDGTDILTEGEWIWNTTGDIVTYSDWFKNSRVQEPNNHAGKEHCLELREDMNFAWNDRFCGAKNQAICQKKNNNFTSTQF